MVKEIEILVEVLDLKENIISKLSNYTFKEEKEVLDIYYYDPLRDDLQIKDNNFPTKWFRIRKKGDENYLTFKEDIFENDKWLYSEENEIKISNFDEALHIIKKLGFEELIRIENKKSTYIKSNFELVIEEVTNLGLFLEIERLHVDENCNAKEIKEEIQKEINSLGIKITDELNFGKPELMLKKKSN